MDEFVVFDPSPAAVLYVEAPGIRYAYRRFGRDSGVPLLLLPHFRGTLDDWDPDLIERLADYRSVLCFDNVGLGLSSGEAPNGILGMAEGAAAFIEALGLRQVDLMGFSLGRLVARQLKTLRPDRVRWILSDDTSAAADNAVINTAASRSAV